MGRGPYARKAIYGRSAVTDSVDGLWWARGATATPFLLRRHFAEAAIGAQKDDEPGGHCNGERGPGNAEEPDVYFLVCDAKGFRPGVKPPDR